jgi:hypothetical protein
MTVTVQNTHRLSWSRLALFALVGVISAVFGFAAAVSRSCDQSVMQGLGSAPRVASSPAVGR